MDATLIGKPAPTNLLMSKISGSPFPSREAGALVRSWGVRFFDLLKMVQDLS
jgi:hypothetical protein